MTGWLRGLGQLSNHCSFNRFGEGGREGDGEGKGQRKEETEKERGRD